LPPAPPPPSGPASRPAPTASPTNACIPWTYAAFLQCFEDNSGSLDVDACLECYNAYYDLIADDTTCGELTALVCNQIEACASSCGTCASFIEMFEACNWDSDCFTGCTSTSVDPCEPELDELADCVDALGAGVESCYSCLADFIPDYNVTCEEGVRLVCSAMDACPDCGNCQAEYVALQNCFNKGDEERCPSYSCPDAAPTGAPSLQLSPTPANGTRRSSVTHAG
jgi:hypothetical protein